MAFDPEGPIGPFIRPELTQVGSLGAFGNSLRADSEQQQQQQQQQQHNLTRRVFLDENTMLPQEEVVRTLTTEIRQTNKIEPRAKR
jgi:hypothetical protein